MKQVLALLIAATLAVPSAHAQTANCATVGTDNNFLGIRPSAFGPDAAQGQRRHLQ